MKIFILIISLCILIDTLSGCTHSAFITNYLTDKKYIVVSNVENCTFVSKVQLPVSPNSRKTQDAPLSAITYLKKFANLRVKGGNTLSQIRLTEREFPLGEANVYQCPQEIFDKYKPLQNDKDYLYSNIKFDLPAPADQEKDKK